MRRWFRLLPLLITALWLPLQAVAAVAMPFCRHAAEQAAAQEDHCPGHGGDTAAAPTGDQGGQACDNCEMCHLASAGYIAAAPPPTASLPAARDFAARPLLAPPSFIPEPPQHPPRRLS